MKLILILLSLITFQTLSQELFIFSEVASSEAKNRKVVSIYADATTLNKSSTSYIGFMYGITGKLTTMNRVYFSRNSKEKFLGDVDLGLNYRFYSYDKKQFHFRMSAFGHLRIPTAPAKYSSIVVQENPELDHLTEANYIEEFPHAVLPDQFRQDNFVPYGGIALTLLNNKFAINLDASYNIPIAKGDYRFGNFFKGGLSFGYLILPRKYKSYNDVNLNIYFEPKVYYFNRNEVKGIDFLESGGWKGDIAGGLQFIFLSSVIFEAGYMRTLSPDNIESHKDLFFTSLKFLFF